MINVLIIIAVALIVHFVLRRDLDKGIAAAVFFLILLPTEVQINVPGALPQLTGHRVVLLVLLVNLFPRISRVSLAPVSRLVFLLCLIGVCRMGSTLFTALDSAASFKVVFGFLIETLLYFILITSGLRSRRTINLVAWSSLLALVIIAGIGTVEKYTGRNLAAMIVPDMGDDQISVSATFRHRILFGYAMAMGFPLALALKTGPDGSRWQRWLPVLGMILLPAACYFGNSRGPWVGCALAGVLMGVAGGHSIRRKLILVGTLAILVLALRPGTYDTINNLWQQSFNKNTIKGRSTDYRLVLWKIAYTELTKTPESMLFGYGGHSTEMLDVSKYFDQGAGGTTAGLGHTSWDSQFASNFMQYGFLDFGLELILYFSILRVVVRTWRASDEQDQPIASAWAAMVLIFFWAMSTVAIFNVQLDYLFWTVTALVGQFHFVAIPSNVSQEDSLHFVAPGDETLDNCPLGPIEQSN